ncbi:TPA: hypothetical protein MIX36_27995, partial [Klebsiella pneumoniae]|nr:hypothetical protein [Klebsiella pneumoniae]
ATVVQGVQIPDTTAVVFIQTVHPAEDPGLQGHPLWNEAKMLRPEADALFIRDYGGNQLLQASLRCTGRRGGVLRQCFHV